MTTFYLEGKSLFIDGKIRQIAEDDTIFCPVCHEPTLYWQVPWSPCYEGKRITFKQGVPA